MHLVAKLEHKMMNLSIAERARKIHTDMSSSRATSVDSVRTVDALKSMLARNKEYRKVFDDYVLHQTTSSEVLTGIDVDQEPTSSVVAGARVTRSGGKKEGRKVTDASEDQTTSEVESSLASQSASKGAIDPLKLSIMNWCENTNFQENGICLGIAEAIIGNDLSMLCARLDEYLESVVVEKRPRNSAPKRKRHRKPISKMGARKARYRLVQRTYDQDRKKAANMCLSGNYGKTQTSVSTDQLLTYWQDLFERDPFRDEREDPKVESNVDQYTAITLSEVNKILTKLKPAGAGPDGVRMEDLKKFDSLVLATVCNGVLYSGQAPSSFTKSRTTLIPKKVNTVDPSEFRPISITNALCRFLHKILAERAAIDNGNHFCQKAFRQVDGCCAQVITLNTVLADARTKQRSLCVAYLDMAKAFDSVSHDSIIRAAKDLGLPECVIAYLRNYYSDGSTNLLGKELRLNNGVRQGDPLSPILFNTVLDKAIKMLDPAVGYSMNGFSYQCLAFADDLVLIAETPGGLQSLADTVTGELAKVGLLANPGKCATLRLIKDGKNKRYLVDGINHFLTISSSEVRALTLDQSYKYLGVPIYSTGCRSNPSLKLGEMLENLRTAPLKPQQRLYMLCSHVIPKLIHESVLGFCTKGTLKALDRQIRNFVRTVLFLPKDTTDGFIHAQVNDGGLQVMSLRTRIPVMRRERLNKLAYINEPDVQAVVTSDTFKRIYGPQLQPHRFYTNRGDRNVVIKCKQDEQKFWRTELYATLDGKGLNHANDGSVTFGKWITDGTGLMNKHVVNGCRKGMNGLFIKAIKIRGNLWPTRARASRGRGNKEGAPMCDSGCTSRECLAHMLQACDRTHSEICERHDHVNSYLCDVLRKRSFQVEDVNKVTVNGKLQKPDLIVFDKPNNIAHVLDTTITSDGACGATLNKAFDEKVTKYESPDMSTHVKRLFGHSVQVKYGALVWDWRGRLSRRTESILRDDLRISASTIKLCEIKVLTGGVIAAEVWNRRRTRGYKRYKPG